MHKDLQNKLLKEFNFLKRGETPMDYFYFGVECGNGWFDLLWNLCKDIEKLGYNGRVTQIKEKYAGLRIYENYSNLNEEFSWRFPHKFNKITKNKIQKLLNFIRIKFFKYMTRYEKIENLIDKAEEKSYKTCEICGNKGVVRENGGWLMTLCITCFLDIINKREEDLHE
jgi:hypothetical protein